VVSVQVGDVDLVHLLRRVAGSLQARQQLAGGRPPQCTGTGIDQHQFAARVDQEGVDRGLGREADVLVLERRLDPFRLRMQDLVDRQGDGAIAQGRDFEVAQHEAVVAGVLGLEHGSGGVGWCNGANSSQSKQRGGQQVAAK
jgi:hypothetical protein